MIILTNVRRDHQDPDTRDRPFKSALCWVLSGQKMDSFWLMSGVSSSGPPRAHDEPDLRVQKYDHGNVRRRRRRNQNVKKKMAEKE